MAANPDKAAAAAALNILQGSKGGAQGGAENTAKTPGDAFAPKALDPTKKKVKKLKPASEKAFAEFKRDIVSRLTRIEQLLEQQAIMLRYPAPIYPHIVPPPPNGVPPSSSFPQPPSSRAGAFPPGGGPLPPPPYPNLPYYPPNAPAPTSSQAPGQPSTSMVLGAMDDGDLKRRRLFGGMDLRDHRKVSNKRGGRGTRKTCRKCAAEGIENVLLVGHKCPYGEAKAVSVAKEHGGVKRASDGLPLSKIDPIRPRGPVSGMQPLQAMLPAVDNMLAPQAGLMLQNAPQGVAPHQNLFASLPPQQQMIPSSQSGTGGKAVN